MLKNLDCVCKLFNCQRSDFHTKKDLWLIFVEQLRVSVIFLCLLAEIAVAQPAFQNHLGTLRAQTPLHGKVISSPFTFGSDKKLSSAWKSSHIPKKLNFNLGHINIPKGSLLIKAVATLESKSSVQNEDARMGYNNSQLGTDSSPWTVEPESSSEDSAELDERERLRRMRISKANKGNTPWNKGRKHSPGNDMLIQSAFCVNFLYFL